MDLNEQKRVVIRFLKRCNAYADGKLAGYVEQRRDADAGAAAGIDSKAARWESYKAFNEHAIAELETDRLDDWFDGTDDA